MYKCVYLVISLVLLAFICRCFYYLHADQVMGMLCQEGQAPGDSGGHKRRQSGLRSQFCEVQSPTGHSSATGAGAPNRGGSGCLFRPKLGPPASASGDSGWLTLRSNTWGYYLQSSNHNGTEWLYHC